MYPLRNSALLSICNDFCHRLSVEVDGQQAVCAIDKYIAETGLNPKEALCLQTTSPFRTTGRYGSTALHLICEFKWRNAFDHVMALCSEPEFLNKTMDDGATALFTAQLGLNNDRTTLISLYMTEELVKRGANPFVARHRAGGATPLYIACEIGRLECAKYLLCAMIQQKANEINDACDTSQDTAMQSIIYRRDLKTTLVNASVTLGTHSCILEWLSSSECSMLWHDGSFEEILKYKHTAYTWDVLFESFNTRINMRNVKHLCTFNYFSSKPADYFVDEVLKACSRRVCTYKKRTLASLEQEIVFIEYMYEIASRRPDFLTLAPDRALYNIIGWLPDNGKIIFEEANLLAGAVRRLIKKYPQLFTDRFVNEFKTAVLTRWLQATDRPQQFQRVMLSVVIVLEWYPYTVSYLKNIVEAHRMCKGDSAVFNTFIDHDILLYYIKRFLIHADVDTDFTPILMFRVLGSPLFTNIWQIFLSHAIRHHVNPCTLIKATAQIVYRMGPGDRYCNVRQVTLTDEHVRFLIWAREQGVSPKKFKFARLLAFCGPSIGCRVFRYLCFEKHKVHMGLGSAFDFFHLYNTQVLYTIMWNTQIRPSQVLARMCIKGCVPTRNYVASLRWIYNLRHLLREPSVTIQRQQGILKACAQSKEQRIVIGPKNTRSMNMPDSVTRNLIELLWEGPVCELSILNDVSLCRVRSRSK